LPASVVVAKLLSFVIELVLPTRPATDTDV
jgi:hypothetical protein